MHVQSLDRVVLSFPTLIKLSVRSSADAPVRSWIQLARTGSFHSNRYGKFAITKDDLAQMYRNFNEVTPTAPTELPIDFDHLSMDPKKPGDGIAAGWMKQLELREAGDELWAEVEWTPDAAKRIKNSEYRFISPSFVKDHTHKDGTKIGTTLLAAAVTNHPFLEGMKALTLYNFTAMGDLATAEPVYHLAEIGQRVMLAPGTARTQDEIGATFEVNEVVGEGDDAFVSVKDATGLIHKWFRATELLPASTTPANPANPPLQPAVTAKSGANDDGATGAQAKQSPNSKEAIAMNAKSASDQLLELMNSYKREHHSDDRTALLALSRQRPELATAHRDVIGIAAEPDTSTTLSLRSNTQSFLDLVNDVKRERRVDDREAMHLAQQLRPDLAQAHAEGRF